MSSWREPESSVLFSIAGGRGFGIVTITVELGFHSFHSEVNVLAEGAGQPVVFAAADVGSNATKVMVWEIAGDRSVRERFQNRFPLRLDDVFRAGQIEPPTVARLIETFLEIADIGRRHGAAEVRAVATEAFRSARNSPAVAEAITLETGIELQVISPEEETRLVVAGVLLDMPVRGNDFVILDIGGGSAQITVCGRGSGQGSAGTAPVFPVVSLALGAVRLREMFIHGDPIAPGDFEALREHVEAAVPLGTASLTGQWSSCAVGCGGGVRFLHAMCGIQSGALSQDQPFRLGQLEHLCEAIWHMPIEALVRHYGIDRERAEIIVPGAVVLLKLMKHLKVNELRPSRRGVRDGLLADFLA